MKIKQKLIVAFSVLILIVLGEIVLNQIVANRATKTYETLQAKINPAINILTKYESINKELNLLISNRINGDNKIITINRFKGIIEVELPHINKELLSLKDDLSVINEENLLVEKIITNTSYLIGSSKKINELLLTIKDHTKNLVLAKEIWQNEVQGLYLVLDIDIRQLNLTYSRSFKTYNIELADNLNSVSQIILITGVIGILLGFIIMVHVTYTISAPISKLKKATQMISKGSLDEQIDIKGKNLV